LEPLKTHAELLAAEAQAKADQRKLELEELRSDQNSAERRVRMWEKVHGLSLPRNPDHPILDLIATKTRLTLQQVREVQQEDAARRAARTAEPKP
jgi:branched-subunit amino acid aminotransferase/4-amino-4-deoxychorismate lyase